MGFTNFQTLHMVFLQLKQNQNYFKTPYTLYFDILAINGGYLFFLQFGTPPLPLPVVLSNYFFSNNLVLLWSQEYSVTCTKILVLGLVLWYNYQSTNISTMVLVPNTSTNTSTSTGICVVFLQYWHFCCICVVLVFGLYLCSIFN